MIKHRRDSHILQFFDNPCLHIGNLRFSKLHSGTMVGDRQGLGSLKGSFGVQDLAGIRSKMQSSARIGSRNEGWLC